MTEVKKTIIKEPKAEEIVKLKGKYVSAVGRRKTASAQVRLYQNGKGIILINEKKATDYFPATIYSIIIQPLKQAGNLKEINISVKVQGGGLKGQAEAIRHGITRALIMIDSDSREAMKAKGWLTRDARKKERKKPGLKKARRAPQWSKR
jgi:small subunit ribosomal protein S9